jgi:hypothetical protein
VKIRDLDVIYLVDKAIIVVTEDPWQKVAKGKIVIF